MEHKKQRKQKQSREELLKKKREAERERYKRIKNDPIKSEIQREKERCKYLMKKKNGTRKLKSDMTERELRLKRKYWRNKSKEYRQRKKVASIVDKFTRENSPPTTESDSDLEISTGAADQISLKESTSKEAIEPDALNICSGNATPGPSNETVQICHRTLRNSTPHSNPSSNSCFTTTASNSPIVLSSSYSTPSLSKKQIGRKQIRRDRSKLYKENKKLKE